MKVYKFLMALGMVIVPCFWLLTGFFTRYSLDVMIASMIFSLTIWLGLIHIIDSCDNKGGGCDKP